jgi:serine/threonine protein kinase
MSDKVTLLSQSTSPYAVTLVYAVENRAMKRLVLHTDNGIGPVLVEVDILSRLRHRHLLYSDALSVTVDGSRIYVDLAMPLAKGTMETHLFKNTRSRLRALSHVASGLAFLHKYGILHGDIKPSNVLVFPQQRPTFVLSDFELSSYSPGSLMSSRHAPWHRLPEAHDTDEYRYDLSCDTWAFGILCLWLLLEKEYPFTGGSERNLDARTIKYLLFPYANSVVNVVTRILLERPCMAVVSNLFTDRTARGSRYEHSLEAIVIPDYESNARCLLAACMSLSTRATLLAFDIWYHYLAISRDLSSIQAVGLTAVSLSCALLGEKMQTTKLANIEAKIVLALKGCVYIDNLHSICTKPAHYTYIRNNVLLADSSTVYYNFRRIPLLRERP